MKIALYYPWIYLTSGIEKTILEIIRRSGHDFVIFTNHYEEKNTYPEFKKFKIIKLSNIPVERSLLSVLKAAFTIASQKIDLKGFDLMLVHSDGLGDLITFRNHGIPIINYCHTPLRPVFDEYYRGEVLKRFNIFSKLPFYLLSYLFKLIDRLLWKKYSYIFFNSSETLRRAIKGRLINKTDKNYQVLYPGTNFERIKVSETFYKYFLVPGRIMWTKNIQLAIKSFIYFKKNPKYADFKLIVAGQVDNKSKSYFKELKKLAINRKDITFVVSPNQIKLDKLYAECWATIQTAFNEDFGFTPIESNAYGKPVVATNSGGYKESQIDKKTGFLVNPEICDIADHLTILAEDKKLTLSMGKYARKYVSRFSWDNFINILDKKISSIKV